MQMLSSEQNEDWLKQEAKAFQNQFENQNNILNTNDFGLDITSWTNNKQQKQQKQQKQNNQKDIEKYYRKKDLKKRSQLDQIVMYNQLALSSSSAKKKQPLQKYQTEQKTFPKSNQFIKSRHQKNYIQIQPEYSYFQSQNEANSKEIFIESKNLLNQNQTSFKKISKKNLLLNIVCNILLIFIIVEIKLNFLILSLHSVEICLCVICKFLNNLFTSQKNIINKFANTLAKLTQIYDKNAQCLRKRILFYKVFIYGTISIFFITTLNTISQTLRTEYFFLIKIFLTMCLGYFNLNLIKQVKKTLFLERQIYQDYLKKLNQKFSFQGSQNENQFDFQ